MIRVTIDSPRPDLGPDWDDLVARASSNVFMNPATLAAATETGFADIRVLTAWAEDDGRRKLVGVWALRLRRFAPLWPAVLEALPYDYAFLSSPVVDPAFADAVVAAFFAAIEDSPLPTVLNLPSFDAEGPGHAAVLKAEPEDGPAREMLRRCEEYLVNPPPPDWRGEHVLYSK